MRNVEKLAIVVILLMVIGKLSMPLYSFVIGKLYGAEMLGQITILGYFMRLTFMILASAVQIGVCVWLFKVAKQEGNATPWVWTLFGLCFGLIAVVLFYAVKIYEQLTVDKADGGI